MAAVQPGALAPGPDVTNKQTSLQLIRQITVFHRAKRVTIISFYQQSKRNKYPGLNYHTIKRKFK
jgi:hypothetical protein